jgi:hypothetical protein
MVRIDFAGPRRRSEWADVDARIEKNYGNILPEFVIKDRSQVNLAEFWISFPPAFY